MSKLNKLNLLTISKLRDMYIQQLVTPTDIVMEIIRRAKEDEHMNIWITAPTLEQIQPYLNNLHAIDLNSSPLWGIPFAIKDNIDLAHIPTTAGCEEYAYTPTEHATVVKKLVEAGAIPVGKTNLDQFATGLVGTRSPYGETHNAYKPELISGGSSSGSAVAVARGQVAFSLGTDTAGSGRVPAGLNNIIGFKPSLGAWSTKGLIPACASLDCITVFANTIEDVLTVDQTVRGYDKDHPWSKELAPIEVKPPKTIFLPNEPLEFFGPYATEYRRAWESTVEQINKLSIPIEYISLSMFKEVAAILYDGPWIAERWASLGEFIETHPNAAFPVTETILKSGNNDKFTASSLFKSIHLLQERKLQVQKLLRNAIVAMPTNGGTWTRNQVRENPIATNNAMGLYTNHCNLLNLSAIAIPSGFAAENIPFGITFFATSNNEKLLFGTANTFIYKNNDVHQEFEVNNKHTLIAVCGLHMRGYPLEKQMKECGASFIKETTTSRKYKLLRLPTDPVKPGLIKVKSDGEAIDIEIWEMPIKNFGAFTASIPAPLTIGKIELENGMEVPGFLCEPFIEKEAENITKYKGWRKYATASQIHNS